MKLTNLKRPLDEHTDAAFFTRFGLVALILHLVIAGFAITAYAIGHVYEKPDPARVHLEAEQNTAPPAKVATSAEEAQKLAQVNAPQTPGAAAGTGQSGEQIAQNVCSACHSSGLMGAPKMHDPAAWQPRLQQAGGKVEDLAKIAAQGKGAMPPRGGQPQLTDEQLKQAIEFMLKSG